MRSPMFADGSVDGLRVRYGFLGRPVLQVRRRQFRVRITGPGPDDVIHEPWGSTGWRDAKRDDIPEMQSFLQREGSAE